MSVMMDDIQYFIKITETQNITRASEILGLSQPTLSYSLKRLEKELGGELIIRLKNGVQVTKLGEEFLKRSRRLLNEWQEAQNAMDPHTNKITSTYHFAIHPSVALYTLSHFLPKIQKKFPLLNFQFSHGLSREMTEKVVSWEADFGIVVNPLQHPDLVIRKLCKDEVRIFYKKGAIKTLIYDPKLAQAQYILKKIKRKESFPAEIKSGNLEVIANMAANGMGYALLPSRVAKQYKDLQSLTSSPIFKDEISFIYRPEKQNNKVSKALIEIMKNTKFDYTE